MLNKELLDLTAVEIQEANEYFEEELLETIVEHYKYQYDCMKYFNAVLDQMYRVCTVSDSEREVEWYEDNDGDSWYHEIPKFVHSRRSTCRGRLYASNSAGFWRSNMTLDEMQKTLSEQRSIAMNLLEELRWNNQPTCSHCGSTDLDRVICNGYKSRCGYTCGSCQ